MAGSSTGCKMATGNRNQKHVSPKFDANNHFHVMDIKLCDKQQVKQMFEDIRNIVGPFHEWPFIIQNYFWIPPPHQFWTQPMGTVVFMSCFYANLNITGCCLA